MIAMGRERGLAAGYLERNEFSVVISHAGFLARSN
jgi:hypothetical protein